MDEDETIFAVRGGVHYYRAQWSTALSWADFRAAVLGDTDPEAAAPGSLRHEIHRQWRSLGLPSKPDASDNGVHGSASPLAGLADRLRWLGTPLDDDATARALLDAGVDRGALEAWAYDTQVEPDGVMSRLDALEGMPTQEAFMYIKPHANTAAVRALVEAALSASGISVVDAGDVDAVDAVSILSCTPTGSEASLSTPSELPEFTTKFGLTWSQAMEEGLVCSEADACKELGGVDAFQAAWAAAQAKGGLLRLEGGFYVAKLPPPSAGADETVRLPTSHLPESAIQSIQTAVREITEEANRSVEDGQYDRAARQLTILLTLDQKNHVLLSHRCAVYINLERYAEAMRDADACVRLQPSWAEGYLRRGSVCFRMGLLERAVAALKKGLELDPGNDALKAELASVVESIPKRRGFTQATVPATAADAPASAADTPTADAPAPAADAPASDTNRMGNNTSRLSTSPGADAPAAAADAPAVAADTAPTANAPVLPAPVPTVDPLTLRFADDALELTYGARCFAEAHSTVTIFCVATFALLVLLAVAFREVWPACAVVGATFPVLLGARIGLHHMADQKRAHRLFSWIWLGVAACSAVGFGVAQRRYVLVSGASTAAMLCVVGIHTLVALFKRLIHLHLVPRLLTYVTISLAWATFSPPISELGQPLEPLLITAALVVGELVAHPFEYSRRRAYVTETRQVADAPPLPVNPLTLRFTDDELERKYGARCFADAYSTVTNFCVAALALLALLAAAFPELRPLCAAGGAGTVVLWVARINLHQMANQKRAHRLFSWGWFGVVACAAVGFGVAQRRYVLTSGVSTAAVLCLAGLYTLFAFYSRLIHLHLAPRLLTYAAVCLTWASFSPPLSELGQPLEPLLMAAALVVGELVAHPFEYSRRRAFVTETGQVADAPPLPVNPLTLRFTDEELERKYGARCFADSYYTFNNFCAVQLVILLLLTAAFRELWIGCSIGVVGLVVLLGMRLNMHRMADQRRAHRLFSWGWLGVWTLLLGAFGVAQRRYTLVSGASTEAMLCVAVVRALGILVERNTIHVPLEPRMFIHAFVCGLFATASPPFSELGSTLETILMAAAATVGELVAHMGEHMRRRALQRELEQEVRAEKAERALTEATAKNAADGRLLHMIKGKCGAARMFIVKMRAILVDIEMPAPTLAKLMEFINAATQCYDETIYWCHHRQTFLQIENGSYVSHPTECDVTALARQLLRGKNGIVVVAAGSERVRLDVTIFRVMYEEALSNACKYREPGTPIEVRAALEAPSDGSTFLHVVMTNTNRADVRRLSEEECRRAFTAGFTTRSVSANSDGVGLDSVTQAAAAVQGKAWLRMREGEGEGVVLTEFHATLPATAAVVDAAAGSSAARPSNAADDADAADADADDADDADDAGDTDDDSPPPLEAVAPPAAAVAADAPAADAPPAAAVAADAPEPVAPPAAAVAADAPAADAPPAAAVAPDAAAPNAAAGGERALKVVGIDDEDMLRYVQETVIMIGYLQADMTQSRSLGRTRREHDAFEDVALGLLDPHTLQPVPEAERRQADVALLDENLGYGMYGRDIAARLNQRGFTGVACVFTASSANHLAWLRTLPGVDCAFDKGCDGDLLALRVKQLLAAKRAAATA